MRLVFSSFFFLLPAMFASQLKRYKDSVIITSLATTSVLYHGTLHPIAKLVDTFVAHLSAFHYISIGTIKLIRNKSANDAIAILCSGISAWMYYMKSLRVKNDAESQRWHLAVHLSAQIALLLHLQIPRKPREPIEYELF